MKRHRLDPLSLIFGILFLGLAATGLVDDVDFTPIDARWVWPTLLLLAGIAVLASSVPARRSVDETDRDEAAIYGTTEHSDLSNLS